MQGLEIENLQQQVQLAKETRQIASSANWDDWANKIVQATGEIVGAGVSGAFGAAGLGMAVKASKVRGETTEIRDRLRGFEKSLQEENGLLRKSEADLVTAKQMAADAKLEYKKAIKDSAQDLKVAKSEKDAAVARGDQAEAANADSKIKEITDKLTAKKKNRDQAEEKVVQLAKEDVKLHKKIAAVKELIKKEEDKMNNVETEVDNLLRLCQSITSLGSASNGLFRGGFNIGAAQYAFTAAESNADIQLNQTMMEVAGKYAQIFGEYRSNFKNNADEFAGAEKSLLESQNEFSKHVSTYS